MNLTRPLPALLLTALLSAVAVPSVGQGLPAATGAPREAGKPDTLAATVMEREGALWKATIRDRDGRVRIVRRYLDRHLRTPHGPSASYHPDGRIAMTGAFRNGQMDGLWMRYHENGRLRDSVLHVNGRKQGVFRQYHPDGRLQAEGWYEDDLAVGTWTGYHPDGRPSAIIGFDRGQAVNVRYFTREGLELREQPDYLLGRKPDTTYFDADFEPEPALIHARYFGTHRSLPGGRLEVVMYDLTGRRSAIVHYKGRSFRNKTGPFEAFDHAGNLRIRAAFRGNLLDGPFQRWHADGHPADSGRLSRGFAVGGWKSWHPGGALKDSGEFRNGMREGLWTEWSLSDRQRSIGLYRRGWKQGDWKHYDRNGRILFVIRHRKTGLRNVERVDVATR